MHLLGHENDSASLAEETIRFTRRFDWDWIKLNPRAGYYPEQFGNTYDLSDLQDIFARQTSRALATDTAQQALREKWKASPPQFNEQFDCIQRIQDIAPDIPIVQTIFSPLSIMLQLAGLSMFPGGKVYGEESPIDSEALFGRSLAETHKTLQAITATTIHYVEMLAASGVSGLFYTTTGTANPKMFSESKFDDLSRRYDLEILNAFHGAKILHTCGAHSSPQRFENYPISALSWDTYAEGNPSITLDTRHIVVGGVDRQEIRNNRGALQIQATAAIDSFANRAFCLAPTCGLLQGTPDTALDVLRQSVGTSVGS